MIGKQSFLCVFLLNAKRLLGKDEGVSVRIESYIRYYSSGVHKVLKLGNSVTC